MSGVIRGVADPLARFKEDPLRILRLVRFGPSNDRTIDPATLAAAKSAVTDLTRISVERIKAELEKILPLPMSGSWNPLPERDRGPPLHDPRIDSLYRF